MVAERLLPLGLPGPRLTAPEFRPIVLRERADRGGVVLGGRASHYLADLAVHAGAEVPGDRPVHVVLDRPVRDCGAASQSLRNLQGDGERLGQRATGADLARLDWYLGFSYFKLVVIAETIRRRHLDAQSPRFIRIMWSEARSKHDSDIPRGNFTHTA